MEQLRRRPCISSFGGTSSLKILAKSLNERYPLPSLSGDSGSNETVSVAFQ